MGKWGSTADQKAYKAKRYQDKKEQIGLEAKLWRKNNLERHKRLIDKAHEGYKHNPSVYLKGDDYIGVTNNLTNRKHRHGGEELIPLTYLKDRNDALIIEAILQTDYGFKGLDKVGKGYYKKAQDKHYRLAQIIKNKKL